MSKKINGLVKKILLCIIDIALFSIANSAMAYLCYDGQLFNTPYASNVLFNYFHFFLVSAIIVIVNHFLGLYKSVWTYAGTNEMLNCTLASIINSGALFVIDKLVFKFAFNKPEIMPFYDYAFNIMLVLFFTCAPRIGYKIVKQLPRNFSFLSNNKKAKRVMIVGAGYMGNAIIEDIISNQSDKYIPVIAVDDNPAKKGKKLNGIKIAGGCDDIPFLVEKYSIDEIIICIPSASPTRLNEIYKICINTEKKVKTSPSLSEILDDGSNFMTVRDVNINDLLSRDEIHLDVKVCKYLIDTTILVTGGGGSIGSELCNQCARYNPKTIVIFDIYENCAFELANELNAKYGDKINIQVRIGSVRDIDRLNEVFEEFHPDVVFHAAAHKHVPLMEDSPCEAVKNNVFGTYNVALTAEKFNVSKMVVLSTDKAVNPTNVMGCTKRITEIIVQYMNETCKNTKFVAVRFGNVLGSHGSVIPIFKKQIAAGGPVCVTHKDITRYFMTIPEAAQLVCQAGGLANGGEVFVLDMGEPVKIMDLAENLIKLSGYTVDEIGIKITGLRPGEKLYEELSMESELKTRGKTANSKIFVNQPMEIDKQDFEAMLEELQDINEDNVRQTLQRIVPNYSPANN